MTRPAARPRGFATLDPRAAARHLLATVLLVAGCSAPDAPQLQRWIADDPQETFDAERLAASQEVFRWSFDEREEFDGWVSRATDLEYGATRRGLAVRSSTGDPQLVRKVQIEAPAIDVVRVAVEGLERGGVELFWSGAAEPFEAAKGLRLRPSEASEHDPPLSIFEFRVGDHPQWRGRIRRLRLDPTTAPGERVVVRWLAGLTEGLPPTEIREAAQAWKVPLGSEYRNALLAFAGDSLDHEATIPQGGRLRLGYGVACGTASAFQRLAPVRLQALVTQGDDDPEIVWEQRLEADDRERALRWSDQLVDLDEYAGQRVLLSLRASAVDSPTRPPCVVAFANPEVTSAERTRGGPNVLLISLDTLRADRLSLYGNPRPTSPRIDAWARERGITFATTVAQAPWTLPSHVSMLTGLEALRHGVNYNSPAPASLEFVAERFRQAGYSTVAITGGGWMSPEYGFSQGFDRYAYWPRGDGEQELRSNMDRLLAWLTAHRDRRFFALFHTYEPHAPYEPRQPYFDRFYDGPLKDRVDAVEWRPPRPNSGVVERRVEFTWGSQADEPAPPEGETLELVDALYDAGVAYTDAQIGRLLRRLQELELTDRTIVVVTSDHGEALGEHGRLQGHGYTYDHNLLVPLVISAPDLESAATTVEPQVRSVDLAPTLLELAGLAPLPGIDGRSLVPVLRGERRTIGAPAWSYAPKGNWGVVLRVDDRLKYRLNDAPWPGLRGTESLYRIDEDPGELHDVAERDPEAERLRRRVLMRVASSPAFRVRFSSAEGETLRGRLRGGLVQPQMIKTVDMPCDCLRWLPPGTVEFEVPPGSSYHLSFHDVSGSALVVEEIRVEGASAVEPPQRLKLNLPSLREPRSLSLTSSGWEVVPGHLNGRGTGLTFWWAGKVDLSATDPSTKDPALAGRLRALGYVE